MTLNQDIVSSFKEAASNFRVIADCIPAEAPFRKAVEDFARGMDEAAECVESVRCETCKWHRFKSETRSACDYWEIFTDDGESCCHWEGKE
jgi:hypothetical protein